MLEELAYVGFYGYGYYSEREALIGVVCRKDVAEDLFELLVDEFYIGEIDGKHSETLCDPVMYTDLNEVVEAIHLSKDDLGALHIFKDDERINPYVKALIQLNDKVSNYNVKPVVRYEVYDGDKKIL